MEMIDARGKACPTPVILAKKMADTGMEAFTVLVDNSTAVENLKRFSDSTGYDATVTEVGPDWSISLCKAASGQTTLAGQAGQASQTDQSKQPGSAEESLRKKTWALFIGSEGIGQGDPVLGASLLKMCLYTLTQGEDLPDYILMMNGGVKVSVEHEQAIEHLKELEARGTTVLVCGACLNFFGMTDDLKAGTLSNMYDILTAMQKVDKVISL